MIVQLQPVLAPAQMETLPQKYSRERAPRLVQEGRAVPAKPALALAQTRHLLSLIHI